MKSLAVVCILLCAALLAGRASAQSVIPSTPDTALVCAAADPGSKHLEGALLVGLVDPQRSPGFGELMRSAPELALVLASYGLDGGKAPQLDMRLQQSFFEIAPTSQLVEQLLQGVEPSPRTVAASSLPPGTKMRVDARTELHGGGSGRIALTSWLLSNDSQTTGNRLHEYSVSLVQVSGKTVDVLQYVNYHANVYRVVSIEKVP